MRNTKKQVLKDLRDVSFNKLVETYYNMKENDSFIIKENEYMEEDMYDESYDESYDEGYHSMMDEESYEESYDEGYHSMMDEDNYDEGVMYEVDMSEKPPPFEESYLTDEDINEMLAEMDAETDFSQPPSRRDSRIVGDVGRTSGLRDLEKESAATDVRDKYRKDGLGGHHAAEKSELEEMFEDMSLEELQQMEEMLREDGDMGESSYDQDSSGPMAGGSGIGSKQHMRMPVNVGEDYMEEDLTESEIEEMMNSMNEEDLEEDSIRNSASRSLS